MTNLTSPASASNNLAVFDVPIFLNGTKNLASPGPNSPNTRARTHNVEAPASPNLAEKATSAVSNSRLTRSGKVEDIPMPMCLERGDPPDCTCILTLVHMQKLEMTVDADGDVPTVLSGQPDEAHWDAIRMVPATLRQALSTADVIDAESLVDRTALVCIDGKWNPAVRILVRGDVDHHRVTRIWSVSEAVMSALTQSAQMRQNLKIDNLHPIEEAAVRQSVEAAIEGSRGCSFEVPLVVLGRDGSQLHLRGKLGRKRDKSDHAPKPLDLNGRIGGYTHFAKDNYFTLHPGEGPNLRIDFAVEQLRAESAQPSPTTFTLVELARINESGVICTIRAHRTLDARGRAVYTFARWLPTPGKTRSAEVATPAATSPAVDCSIMTSANTVTNS